jgi:putative transposase
MPYNPNKHHRKSIRLKGYDYSKAGLYFITICVQNRARLFGEIKNGEMILNEAGMMVKKWYHELENKFPNIRCHEMIIMPNHFHCIIEIVGNTVGADLRVYPENDNELSNDNSLSYDNVNLNKPQGQAQAPRSDPATGPTISQVIQWFKTMTTNEYIRGVNTLDWRPFDGKLWQRNYWEHIIRNPNAYQTISEYIINNPKKWGQDKFKK